MYIKKQFEKRYLLIIIIVIIAIMLVILSVAINKNRNLSFPEKIIKDSGTFITQLVASPFNFVKDKFNEGGEKNDLYDKYKKLKEKEEQIDSIIAETNNLKDEIKTLKDQLKLNNTLSEYEYKNATVINRNIDYWYDEITIDKGSKNGIEKNMAVVTNEGLVGRISKVSNYTSTVKLITNPNMSDKVSVKIKVDDGYVYGLIYKYSAKNNSYTVEGISENIKIPVGAEVVTTGMGDTFPSGLLVGKVTKVTTDNFDLSKVVIVKNSTDVNKIEYVTVIKRKVTK